MGSLFRSEEMTLCQLFLQSEAAYACVSELGELGVAQFRDLNPNVNAFQRKFVNEVRRCDEMERKLRYLEREIKKDKIPILDVGDNPEAPQPREMIDLEATFEKLESDLIEVNTNADALKRTYFELTEITLIFRQAQKFFNEQQEAILETESMQRSLISHDFQAAAHTQLNFVVGVVLRDRMPAFERMLWRVCRGMAFLRQADIEGPLEDPVSGDEVFKTVFIVFFQGEQFKSKVMKICEGFRATLYPCPSSSTERQEMSAGVTTRLADLKLVLSQSLDHRYRVLVTVSKNIRNWYVKVRKVKAIYATLNLFNLDVTQKCLIAECWCPVRELDKIQTTLRKSTEDCGSSVPSILNRMDTKEIPPTYNRTNRFTMGFQAIVDAYGVSDYREVNPAPFTIITFPFLFAVMFGDFGHGLLMAIFAAWMVWKERKLAADKSDNEIWTTIFGGRYIILLMGLFSIYTGLIYNDVFSKSFNIFGSSWQPRKEGITPNEFFAEVETLNPANSYYGKPYPLGIDPVWQLAQNKIVFLNSYKMKTAIVFGVFQMLFGVILSVYNHAYFRRPLNFFCDFIPQMIFLLCLFGYLVVLIFYKWITARVETAGCSPSLLIHFINMFLFSYQTEPCSLAPVYTGQQTTQTVLVVFTVVCIPWMLLAKPLILRQQSIRRKKLQQASLPARIENIEDGCERSGETPVSSDKIEAEETAGSSGQYENKEATSSMAKEPADHGDGHGGNAHGDSENFDFGALFIPQAIHTIEYCLGSISHTASYLRLWALSLAHAQLSEVLWNMLLIYGLKVNNAIGGVLMFAIFTAWATLTVSVLLIMEGLSAFLHALRLHWVEFQSKFFGANGYLFAPFAFKTILENASSEEI